MLPQGDGVLIARELADDRAEDGRSGPAVEHDGRDPEAAGVLNEGLVLGQHRLPGPRIVEGLVAEARVQAGLGQRLADWPAAMSSAGGTCSQIRFPSAV